jgi:hypothetical protein
MRELMQQGSNTARWMSNRWSTRFQKAQRGSINLDEAYAEQWTEAYG